MMLRSLVLAFGLALFFAQAAAADAPKPLYNKSVTIRWSEQTSQKNPDGRIVTPIIESERTVYISSAGRLFVRGKRSINNRNYSGGNQFEKGPNESASSGVLRFQGNQLVGTGLFNGFARRVVVSFDGNFSTCSGSVVYGRASGPQTWQGFDGKTYELLSISVSGVSCSIREGNAFAD